MDRSGLIKLLQEQIREMDSILKSIEQSPSTPRIDIDLLLSKIRNFYEGTYLLLREPTTQPQPPQPHPQPSQPSQPHSQPPSVNEMPLANIFDAIGLNDQFLYVRELFQNDTSLFKETVSKLNEATSYEQAIALTQPLKWNPDDPVVQVFLALVKRRFLT